MRNFKIKVILLQEENATKSVKIHYKGFTYCIIKYSYTSMYCIGSLLKNIC